MRVRNPETGRYMKAPDPQPSSEALTASVATLPASDIDKLPRYAEGWQLRAWRLWRVLGVLYFPTSFKAKQVARLDWKVEVDGVELDEDKALAALEAVTYPMSVREAARRIALNYEVAGELWYARQADEWCVLASTTPRLKQRLKGADVIIHDWQPDPEFPNRPTSSIQASLDTFEAIRLMSALSRSQDRNRLAQRGILLVPKDGHFADDDPFMPKLEASMTAPLANEYDGSAVVPLVVDFTSDLIEKWRYLSVDSAYDDKLMARIEATIRQAALELDMPPEMLLGNMDSNHWNAWLSSEENYRAHVEPLGENTAEVFAEAMMQATAGAVDVKVIPDPTKMLMRKLSAPDLIEGIKIGAIGAHYYRETMGLPEDAAPTPDELDQLIALTRGREQVTPGPQGVPGTNVEAPALPAPASTTPTGNGAGPSPAPSSNGVTAAASGKRDLETLGRRLTDMDIRLLSVLEGLASMAVDHARNSVSAEAVGAEQAVQNEMFRLGKAWNREVTQARKALRSLGIDTKGQAWDQAQEASVHVLTTELASFVTQNLSKTDSEMPALPVLVLRRVLATAGGSGTAVVSAITRNPAPTFQDPQGFALGVLTVSDLKDRNVSLTQWRFRYGPLTRDIPFPEHEDADGQFMTADGVTGDGWYPGDHKGCECQMDPVFVEDLSPDEVADAVAEGD